ncbi:hypothetical protein FOZ62_027957 [Perkinsus olseni]|uniref:Peptidase A1 domain-containing protein n=1 Tax=Perkinsus olseni TaxID=32597 RepID=A0A7J6SVE9_PEROL|nr:hypothetical protein FOZ62_027957 [Perkinsus olseni]
MPWDIAGHALHWLETAGQASVTIREDRGFFEISCQDAKYLPSITYFMEAWNGEEVPLEIPSTSYVYKKTEAICILAITFRDRWILGLPALIGHYFLYDWQNGQIGFAKVSVLWDCVPPTHSPHWSIQEVIILFHIQVLRYALLIQISAVFVSSTSPGAKF